MLSFEKYQVDITRIITTVIEIIIYSHLNRLLNWWNFIRFHDLRHSAASYLAMNGASLLEIAEVLGHRSIETTKRYSHLSVEHKQQLTDRILGALA